VEDAVFRFARPVRMQRLAGEMFVTHLVKIPGCMKKRVRMIPASLGLLHCKC
jgi:hypothetical protein